MEHCKYLYTDWQESKQNFVTGCHYCPLTSHIADNCNKSLIEDAFKLNNFFQPIPVTYSLFHGVLPSDFLAGAGATCETSISLHQSTSPLAWGAQHLLRWNHNKLLLNFYPWRKMVVTFLYPFLVLPYQRKIIICILSLTLFTHTILMLFNCYYEQFFTTQILSNA